MVCSEQDIIRINKSSCNSSNVANTIMVQQTVRTSSEAANDYRKQISATPSYKSKTFSLSQTETARMLCTRDQHRQAQFRKKQSMSSMKREEMERKTNINTYSEDGKNFVVKGTTIQCRLIQI